MELRPAGPPSRRIHHCIADGRALVAFLGELADEAPASGRGGRARPPPSPRCIDGEDARTTGDRGLFRFLTLSGDPEAPAPSSGRPQARRLVGTDSLDSIKSVARARGHHVTDVLLAGVAARSSLRAGPGQASRAVRALFPVALPSKSAPTSSEITTPPSSSRLPIAATEPRARIEAIAREMAARRSGVSREWRSV